MLVQLIGASGALAGAYEPELTDKDAYKGRAIYPLQIIDNFNDASQATLWTPGQNVEKAGVTGTLLNAPGAPYEGAGALEVTPLKVKAYEWRTVSRAFDAPLDLSDANFLAAALDIWGWKQDDFFVKLTLRSGGDTFEAVSGIAANKWNVVYFDIRAWSGRTSIDGMSISYMKNYDLEGMSPGDPGYDYWDGRLQIDSLAATAAADLDFHIPGSAEGFTAMSGTAIQSAAAGSLKYVVTDPSGSYIESPGLSLDAAKRNAILLRMANGTGASRLKVAWTTEDDPVWDEEKSQSFPASDSGSFADYELVLMNSLWKGVVDRVRIYPEGATAGTTMDIDKIDFALKSVDEYVYQGNLAPLTVAGDPSVVTAEGSVGADYLSAHPDATVGIYGLPLFDNEKSADYSTLTPLAETAAGASFSMTFPAVDGVKNRVYDKFVAVLKDGDNFALVDGPHYVTNPEALAANKDPYPSTDSIKGLQVQLPADAERLGVRHGAINIAYNEMLTLTDHGDSSIPYSYEGQTYYFRKNTIAGLDSQIKSMTDNKMAVTAILILYRTGMTDPDSPNKDIVHPDATAEGTVFAPNLTNETGVRYYEAITRFLAERYSRADRAYGRLAGYIVGNEVGQNKVWNNMGPKLLDEYVKQYERQLRLTYNIVRSVNAGSRAYISLDHFWNDYQSPDSQWIYSNRALVDALAKLARAGGDYAWDVAFHPYPEDLFDPKTWEDTTATDSFDTRRITFKNLQVLTQYLQQASMTYEGAQRHVILSEQGFHSGGNTPEEQRIQAAAYAYAYYKVKSLPGIDAFILHRHVDHAGEGGLNLGLWTNMKGQTAEADQPKVIYDVFKQIDTVNSLEATAFAKSIIGVDDWSEAIPGFDPAVLENKPAQETAPMGAASGVEGNVPLSDFELDADGWQGTDNAAGAERDAEDRASGESSLKARVVGGYRGDFKGVTRSFEAPLDLSATPVIRASVKASGIGSGAKAEFMIRAYSGARVIEGSVVAPAEAWNDVAIDLTGWAGLSSVDRIKIWARPSERVAWTSGALQVDDVALASSAAISNVSVVLEALPQPGKVQAGDTLTVTVNNGGNRIFASDIGLKGTGGIALDRSVVQVSVQPGALERVETTVTEIVPVEGRKGTLEVTADGKTYTFDLTEAYDPDYKQDGDRLVFGDFEGGVRDGWTAGTETSAVGAVKKGSNGPPGAAKQGSYMLEAAKTAKIATTESKAVKTFKTPVDLRAYSKIDFDFFGWGGTSSAYMVKLKLTSESGETFVVDKQIASDGWISVSADISAFEGRDSVKSLEISYRGKDTAHHSGPWGGYFFIDHIRTDAAAVVTTGISAAKPAETLTLGQAGVQLAIQATMSDGSQRDVSASTAGTRYEGYDSLILSVSPDGLMEAKAAGTTVVRAVYGAFDTAVSVTVNEAGGPENPGGPDTPAIPARPSAVAVAVPGGIATATLDRATGELRVALDSAALDKALDAAPAGADERRSVLIKLPETAGASFYTLTLPAAFFAASDRGRQVTLETALGTVSIPSDMLAKDAAGEEAGEIAIRVAPVDRSLIGPAAAMAIGDRPLIEIVLLRNGKAEPWHNPKAQVIVSIPYAPTEEELRSPDAIIACYVNDQGGMVPISTGRYESESGAVVFAIHHLSQYGVAFAKKSFADLDRYPWARDGIEALASKGIVSGIDGRTFEPSRDVTRAEFAVMLAGAMGFADDSAPSFSDVKPTDFFYQAVGVLQRTGIANGAGDGRFLPGAAISRQEMMTMTARALRLGDRLDSTAAEPVKEPEDFDEISAYAREAISRLEAAGLIQGYGGRIRPAEHATRAETAVFLYRIYDYQWLH